MAKINHARPILRLIDDLKRMRATPPAPKDKFEIPPTISILVLSPKSALGAINAGGKELEALLHQLACSVLDHVARTGDVKLVNRLIAALPEFMRTNALRAWFDLFGSIDFVGGRAKSQRVGKVMLEEAIAIPFWKLPSED